MFCLLPKLVGLYFWKISFTLFRPRTLKIFTGEQIYYIEKQEKLCYDLSIV